MKLYAVERMHVVAGTSYMLNNQGAIQAFPDVLYAARWAARLNAASDGGCAYRVVTVSSDANTDLHPVYASMGETLPDWR